MLCSVCKKNEASVHLTQVVENKLEKIDLCEACSQEKGVSDTTGYALAELLLGMTGAKVQAPPPEGPPGKTSLRCPHCGFTQADLKKTARLGCPECYETFSSQLSGMLKSMHRGTRHIGKVPSQPSKAQNPTAQLDEVQAELNQAVAEEDFERAAILRDRIRELKANTSTPA